MIKGGQVTVGGQWKETGDGIVHEVLKQQDSAFSRINGRRKGVERACITLHDNDSHYWGRMAVAGIFRIALNDNNCEVAPSPTGLQRLGHIRGCATFLDLYSSLQMSGKCNNAECPVPKCHISG